jgi:hypothetical protein
MSWLSFKEYLRTAGEENHQPLCLVVGAGIHSMPKDIIRGEEHDALRILSSWDSLIEELVSNNDSDIPVSMRWDFEMFNSTEFTGPLPAYKRDVVLLKKLKSKIEQSESIVLKSDCLMRGYDPLVNFINDGCISDIVCLNFDKILEELLLKRGYKRKKGSSNIENRHSVLFKNDDKFEKNIRIWYPNGDCKNLESIKLGYWHFNKGFRGLANLFSKLKRDEKNLGYDAHRVKVINQPDNWLQLFIFRPLLFIGTSIDFSDSTQWAGLLMRWRNFSKIGNSNNEQNAWRLCIPEDGLKLPKNKFLRLEGPNYEDAWKFLNAAISH